MKDEMYTVHGKSDVDIVRESEISDRYLGRPNRVSDSNS